MKQIQRKPNWFKVSLSDGGGAEVKRMLNDLNLNTVCREARCPNLGECFNRGTATFLILGDICTRNCRFCAVESGIPLKPSPDEPQRVAEAVRRLKLRHCVITGVNRDDLPLGGAEYYAETVKRVREMNPAVTIEVLPGDFSGSYEALKLLLDSAPDVFNHNLETVERLTPVVRDHRADYRRSLEMLKKAKEYSPTLLTKSGILSGLGEILAEIIETLKDLRAVGCEGVTIGQYIPPSPEHFPVARYYHPDEFAEIERIARELGFTGVAAAPLVRSSYQAADFFSGKNQIY